MPDPNQLQQNPNQMSLYPPAPVQQIGITPEQMAQANDYINKMMSGTPTPGQFIEPSAAATMAGRMSLPAPVQAPALGLVGTPGQTPPAQNLGISPAMAAAAAAKMAPVYTGREAIADPTMEQMAGITKASVNALKGLPTSAGAGPPNPGQAPPARDLNYYLGQIMGGDPNQFGFQGGPEERYAALQMMRGDQQAQQHMAGLENLEKMKIASQEKIAGMHYNPEHQEQKDAESTVKQANALRDSMVLKGIAPDQANLQRNAMLEQNGIDPKTGKKLKEQPAKPGEVQKPGEATQRLTAQNLLNQMMAASEPASAANPNPARVFDPRAAAAMMQSNKISPDQMKSLIDEIKKQPDWEKNFRNKALSQLGTDMLTFQSTGDEYSKPITLGGYSAQVKPANQVGKGINIWSKGLESLGMPNVGGAMSSLAMPTKTIRSPSGTEIPIEEVPSIFKRAFQSDQEHNEVGKRAMTLADLISQLEK